ncbi:unnamed protein product [Angiostrongylus costaricensis]|uniref:DOMON domain-containing protein n=1 Tax=Angiostrongylus costaricensis TaxID=334426 RepID=A0A0R3PY50_ANGCS|nr:unnamed protein product [Angiostrongylus costaricensis]
MTSMMFLPDFGLNTNDVRYFSIDSIIRGNGSNRLKYLDLEGRWNLSGKSVPYITSAFGHLENLNYARVPFEDITDEPLNAIGMVGWTPESEPVAAFKKKPTAKFQLPVSVLVNDDVPVSPRESVPHRSAGYGPAHQKRKLLISDRSRSTSPVRAVPTVPTYDKYAMYERNRIDSMTRFGTKWGVTDEDSGSSSAQKFVNDTRPPHRTPALSPRISTPIPGYISGVIPYKSELKVVTRDTKKVSVPYRSAGYGAYHERRQYELSPRSIGSAADHTSRCASLNTSPFSVEALKGGCPVEAH